MTTAMFLPSLDEVDPQDGVPVTHCRRNGTPIRGYYQTRGSLILFARFRGLASYLLWLRIWFTIVSSSSSHTTQCFRFDLNRANKLSREICLCTDDLP